MARHGTFKPAPDDAIPSTSGEFMHYIFNTNGTELVSMQMESEYTGQGLASKSDTVADSFAL